MKVISLCLLILPQFLLAGNIFKSAGDPEWLKETLGLEEISGFEILESENSSVLGHRYCSYKIRVTDSKNIFTNLNLKSVRKLKTEENLKNRLRCPGKFKEKRLSHDDGGSQLQDPA